MGLDQWIMAWGTRPVTRAVWARSRAVGTARQGSTTKSKSQGVGIDVRPRLWRNRHLHRLSSMSRQDIIPYY